MRSEEVVVVEEVMYGVGCLFTQTSAQSGAAVYTDVEAKEEELFGKLGGMTKRPWGSARVQQQLQCDEGGIGKWRQLRAGQLMIAGWGIEIDHRAWMKVRLKSPGKVDADSLPLPRYAPKQPGCETLYCASIGSESCSPRAPMPTRGTIITGAKSKEPQAAMLRAIHDSIDMEAHSGRAELS